MKAYEVNFDGIVGPTHNYAGLSVGNVASQNNADRQSRPKEAALQGLEKMKALHDKGLKQAVLPPLERPDVGMLRKLGFSGNDAQMLKQAFEQAPIVYASVCSASSMWTANACTVSPGADTKDGKVHFTPANLSYNFHRSIEHTGTAKILQSIFANEKFFSHHQALPTTRHFGDEGAANHTRFCREYGEQGVEFFVYGQYAFDDTKVKPALYPARQTFEASESITRLHQLDPDKTVLAQQSVEAIDAGVFHNDVISVGNKNCLFYHEQAFQNNDQTLAALQKAYGEEPLHFICVPKQLVSIQDAVTTYLFNSQLVSISPGEMMLITPEECKNNHNVNQYLQELLSADTPIKAIEYFNLKQSMRNGGGPACLRQRVVLNEAEMSAANQAVFMSDKLYETLTNWVNKHYRDLITHDDLADETLLIESRTALDELTQILKLGSVYPFQQ
ncbi:MAG: N-succinylarginine dihydrolase [Gammaproteobacteria bacterium]|nr:N-succinylarginine dihydrolase [Gammaproteobacteria bacterium]MDH5630098.1 N-succinylarginine dihydrolase [Gammaproteobacteria bacterium]